MRNIVELNYEEAHALVEKSVKTGFFWDGYTIVKWSPGHNGYVQTNGMYRNGKWGYSSRFVMTDNGTWSVPSKYVQHP